MLLNSLPHFVYLGNVCETIKKLQENYIDAEELQSILPSLGITLSDKEFKKIVTDTARNGERLITSNFLKKKIRYFYMILNVGVRSLNWEWNGSL